MGNNGQAGGGFDTLAAARAMEAAGVERRQAEGIAMTMRDAVTLGAATKADIGDVRRENAGAKAELKEDIADVRREIAAVKAELKEDIASLRTELKTDIANLDNRMSNLETRLVKIIFAVAGGQTALIVTLLKLFE